LSPNCRKVFGNFDGQISYKNNQSNKPVKTPIRIFITLLLAAMASYLIGLALLTPANAAKPRSMIARSPSTNGTFD